jgi:hypothetical protein
VILKRTSTSTDEIANQLQVALFLNPLAKAVKAGVADLETTQKDLAPGLKKLDPILLSITEQA